MFPLCLSYPAKISSEPSPVKINFSFTCSQTAYVTAPTPMLTTSILGSIFVSFLKIVVTCSCERVVVLSSQL